MENKKEYLSEQNYKRIKSKISISAFLILLIGTICSLVLVIIAISNKSGIDVTYVKAQRNAEFFANGSSPKYYELGSQLDKANSSTLYFMFAGFIITSSCFISGFIYMSTKRRELLAYKTQQVRPVVEEGIEKISPYAGIAAKEIAKGVKTGLSDNTEFYCKLCGSQIDSDSIFCKKCGKKL